MSLTKFLSGRKRGSVWWEFFYYDEGCEKSTCLVVNDATKVACGTKIAGKNTSNFAAHLKRFHKEAHETCVNKEKAIRSPAVKRDITGAVKSQTIAECLQRRIVSWPKDSTEHHERVQSVMEMVISTGCPITLLDQPSFRKMMAVMDQKFKMPGLFTLFFLLQTQ